MICGFSELPANEERFQLNKLDENNVIVEKREITVVDYFKETYKKIK